MIADDVEHDFQAVLIAHPAGEIGELQALGLEVLVDPVEIDAPVAVIARLAAVREKAFANPVAAGEGLVGIVDDGRDPHCRESHLADIGGVVENPLEVAAKVTDVVGNAGRRHERPVEGSVCATLGLLIIGRVAVDETIGEDEVDGLGRERLGRAVVVRLRRRSICRRCANDGGHNHLRDRSAPHCGLSSRSSTRSVARPARIISTPPVASA